MNLLGRQFEIVDYRASWGTDWLYYYNERGCLIAIPASWTDFVEPDPFVAISNGRALCRAADLPRLAVIVAELGDGDV